MGVCSRVGRNDDGEPWGAEQVSGAAGTSEAPATPAQPPQPLPQRPHAPETGPGVAEEGNDAGVPCRVGSPGAADPAGGGHGGSGSPTAAAAKALRTLASAHPEHARDRPIRKRQRLVGNVFIEEGLPLNVLRAGKGTKSPGHHSGIRPTADFYSPNGAPFG